VVAVVLLALERKGNHKLLGVLALDLDWTGWTGSDQVKYKEALRS